MSFCELLLSYPVPHCTFSILLQPASTQNTCICLKIAETVLHKDTVFIRVSKLSLFYDIT